MFLRRRGPGLIRTAARTAVIAGTATAVTGTVARRQQRKAYEEQASMQAAAGNPTPAAATPSQPDYVQELERLAQLRKEGIITEADFEAKKKQLLGI